jgi:hypothetical protein
MNKKILILVGLLSLAALAGAVISSYGSITGYATVEQGITIDIMGSSNDETYNLNKVYQGDTEYSPEIKLVNKANRSIDVNVLLNILPESSGNENDVTLYLVNEFKNETLTNPITVPTTDLRIRIKHEFKDNANLGNYSFDINVVPV